jgi:hypothetical protein
VTSTIIVQTQNIHELVGVTTYIGIREGEYFFVCVNQNSLKIQIIFKNYCFMIRWTPDNPRLLSLETIGSRIFLVGWVDRLLGRNETELMNIDIIRICTSEISSKNDNNQIREVSRRI